MAQENPTPTQEYKRDVGSGEQLPSGGATQANEDLALGNDVEETLDAQDLVQPMEPAEFDDEYTPPEYQPKGDLDSVLFGPSETFAKRSLRKSGKPVPNTVVQALPLMSTIVNDPDTPPVFKALYRYYIRKLAQEREAEA